MKLTCYLTNKIKVIVTNIFILSIIILLLTNSKICTTSIYTSTNIFITKLLPALFPYILITELLINTNLISNLSFGIASILTKLFKIPKDNTICVIIGFLLGYPNSATYINKQFKEGNISKTTCKKLASFTNNANPSYVIATIGVCLFNSPKIGIILLVSHYISALIIGIIYTSKHDNSIIQQTYTNSNSLGKIYFSFDIVIASILGTLKTMGIIFSFTVIFSLIPKLIIAKLNLPELLKTLIICIFEISNGIVTSSDLTINIAAKLCLISFTLSFSSIMVILQIYSYLYVTGIKLKFLFKIKFIQGILSGIITYITIHFWKLETLTVFNNMDRYINTYVILPSLIYIIILLFTILILLFCTKKCDKNNPVA